MHDWGVQRRCVGRGVRPFEAGRQGDQGGRLAQEQLGLGHRYAALFGVPGYGRNHLYLRWAEDKHAGAGVGHGGRGGVREDWWGQRCRRIGESGRAPTRDAPTEEGRGRQWNGRIAGGERRQGIGEWGRASTRDAPTRRGEGGNGMGGLRGANAARG